MISEQLNTIRTVELASNDGWSYLIKIYEDVTDILIKDNKDAKEVLIGQLTSGYDIQVCEEIIKLRKQKQQEECEE